MVDNGLTIGSIPEGKRRRRRKKEEGGREEEMMILLRSVVGLAAS